MTADPTRGPQVAHRPTGSAIIWAVCAIGAVGVGAAVLAISRDVIMAVTAAAILFAIASRVVKGRTHAHR
jgi:hypothetical protein